MNKSVYLGLSILELSKILMCEFWYNYVKPKYCEKEKLSYGYIHCFSVTFLKILQKMFKLALILQVTN